MQNIFLAPTTFGQFSDQPMQLFKQNDLMIHSNQLGRKLQPKEIIKLAKDAGMNAWHGGPIANSAVAEALTSVLLFINRNYGIDGSGFKITGTPSKDEA